MKIRPFFRAAVLAAVSAVCGMAWAQDAGTNSTGAGASENEAGNR